MLLCACYSLNLVLMVSSNFLFVLFQNSSFEVNDNIIIKLLLVNKFSFLLVLF